MTQLTSPEALSSYAWRIPFLVAIIGGIAGLYIRLGLEETPEFSKVQQKNEVSRSPIGESFRYHKRAMLVVIGLCMGYNIAYIVAWQYLSTYIVNVGGMSLGTALGATAIGLVIFIPLCPVMGALSDRFGRKPLLALGSLGFVIIAYPVFYLAGSGNFAMVVLGFALIALCLAMYSGAVPTAMAELFPTRIRYSALSVSYNVAATVFGGTLPLIAVYLASRWGAQAPSFYMMAASLISFLTVIFAVRESAHDSLRDV